jgi:hypothetical protein
MHLSEDQIMGIKKGDHVAWTSNSGGVARERQGVVVKVLPAKQPLTRSDVIPLSSEYSTNDLLRQLTQVKGVRLMESYIIAVKPERGNAIRLYWPHAHQVKKISKTTSKESEACQESTQSLS